MDFIQFLMMEANADNSPAIKVITFAQVDLRRKMYCSDFLFNMLMDSHTYFYKLDEAQNLLNLQNSS